MLKTSDNRTFRVVICDDVLCIDLGRRFHAAGATLVKLCKLAGLRHWQIPKKPPQT